MFCLGLIGALDGCANTEIPRWVTGEPDMKELYENRTILASPPAQTQPWPNLADVPPRRTDFSPSVDRQDDVQNMSRDYDEAETAKKKFEETPPPEILPLPPPSSIDAAETPSEDKKEKD